MGNVTFLFIDEFEGEKYIILFLTLLEYVEDSH